MARRDCVGKGGRRAEHQSILRGRLRPPNTAASLHVFICVMNFVLKYASSASAPPSLPKPESFTPPKRTSGHARPWWLIDTIPLSIAWPIASAVLVERVYA